MDNLGHDMNHRIDSIYTLRLEGYVTLLLYVIYAEMIWKHCQH